MSQVTVYAIVEVDSGIVGYVGATTNFARRKWQHLNRKTQCLKDTWLESIGHNVTFVVLQVVEPDKRDEAEKYWIEHYKRLGIKLHNETSGGCGLSGYSHEETTKAKISAGNKGKKRTPEMIAAMKLRVSNPSEETRRKMSAAKKGKTLSEDAKENLRVLMVGNKRAKGYKHTPEALAKISASSKLKSPFKGRTHTEEAKLKMSEAQRNKVNSPETIEKMRTAQQALSEHKRQAMLKYWAERKAKVQAQISDN